MKGFEIPTVAMRPPRFKKDKSVTLGFDTGEMSSTQKMQVLDNDGALGTLIFVPEDLQIPPEKIETEYKQKTLHERERAVMFVYWKQKINTGDFNDWFRNQKEAHIQKWKDQLTNDEYGN